MRNEIISYQDMCTREGRSLQRGMNFQPARANSIILMSTLPNAPYSDRIEDGGLTLIYEGHDVAKTQGGPEPKEVDQPLLTSKGALTENGKFHKAAQAYKQHGQFPTKVKVYEKIRAGIWSYNGLFDLLDSWQEHDGKRLVCKFKLVLSNPEDKTPVLDMNAETSRIIPSSVKREVWKRDGGKCVLCGSSTELHFDHIIPYSKGGTSLKAENIQLLCVKHNLEKRNKIE